MAETTTVDPTLEKATDAGVPETKEAAVDVPAVPAHETTHAGLHSTDNVNQIEAPVTWQAYLICAFASFGGIFFGYDSGYINGVTGAKVFINMIDPGQSTLSSSHNSLIVSILSAGTFFGAIAAGDVAERIGRKWTVIIGCLVYLFGVVIQMITGAGSPLGAIVAGRLISGIGVGFESAIVILYMSEIVRLPFLLSLEGPKTQNTNFRKSAPERFAVPSLPVTNSASLSVFSWPRVLPTPPSAALILAPTAFPSASSLPGVSSLVVACSSCQTLPVTSSSAADLTMPPMPSADSVDSPRTPNTSRLSLLRSLPTRSTSVL